MKPCALVVDDDPDIIQEVRDSLETLNHECDAADSVTAAVSVWRKEYTYFVIDLQIPVHSGHGLSRIQNGENLIDEIIVHYEGRKERIIAITAHGNDGPTQAVEIMKKGIADYVPKPFPTSGKTLDKAILAMLARGECKASKTREPDASSTAPADVPAGLVGVPWWHALDLQSQELHWEPELLSVSGLAPDAILGIARKFRTTVNEMYSTPEVVGRWAELGVLKDCETLAILVASYGLDPKPLLQMAWNIDKNRFKAGDWPFSEAFRSCLFLLTEIETRAKAAIVNRLSQQGTPTAQEVTNEPRPVSVPLDGNGHRETTTGAQDRGHWFCDDPPKDSKFKFGSLEGPLKRLAEWMGMDHRTIKGLNGGTSWWVKKVHGKKFAAWFSTQEKYAVANQKRLATDSQKNTK